MLMSILTLEVIEPFTVKEHGRVSAWQVGQRVVLSPEKAQRVIDRVGDKVRVVNQDTMEQVIGTAVEASLVFQTEAGVRVEGMGPWIVADADMVATEKEPGFLAGRWLLLVHGLAWRWCHETKIEHWSYHCPTCKGARFWWSADTVLCVQCIPPSVPQWQGLWREVADLSVGITLDAPLLDALRHCDEAFKAGDYTGFQAGVVRVRRAAQRPMSLETKK